MFGVAKPSALSLPHSAGRSFCSTSASTRFCSCVTRTSPKLKRSASSAIASISAAVASPGGVPVRFSDSVTLA